ncbi:MAG: DUF3311 domain-containing protein [Lentisphaeraceae bacterium]|nr:DUF3311 domain-containing protein [Lentisphaeraceae bacterium]
MTPKARNVVFVGVLVLMFLHHDFWLWSDKTLIFGFLPSGLAWHAGYSVVAALFWYFVMKFAWPQSIEDFAEGKVDTISAVDVKEDEKKEDDK